MSNPNFPDNYRLGTLLATDCLTPYTKILRLGLSGLQQDMERAEPYNHDNRKGEYHGKNAYFDRANEIAMPFLELGITGMTKLYYWEMLNAIGKYENDSKKPLNKGMATLMGQNESGDTGSHILSELQGICFR